MCLSFIAQIPPDAPAKVSARRLSKLSGLCVVKLKSNSGEALHFSVNGGCSCNLLADDFQIDAPVWNLDTIYLPALTKAIELLGKVSGKFRVRAHWLGGEIEESHVTVSLEELLDEISENRMRNGVIYTVTSVNR